MSGANVHNKRELHAGKENPCFYVKLKRRFFELTQDYFFQTDVKGLPCEYKQIVLNEDGMLHIKAGYRWNGPTGSPAYKEMIRGSLVHDALYALFSSKGPLHKNRPQVKRYADKMLFDVFIIDGVSRWLANMTFYGARDGSWLFEN